MIVVGGENLIDYVQVSEGGDLPVYRAIPRDLVIMLL